MDVPPYTPCGYCFSEWATGWDHLIPRVAGGHGTKDNLYPSCKRCNSILGSRIFASIEEKRDYVWERLHSQDVPVLRPMRKAYREDPKREEVLFKPVPVASMGRSAPKKPAIKTHTDPKPKRRRKRIKKRKLTKHTKEMKTIRFPIRDSQFRTKALWWLYENCPSQRVIEWVNKQHK